MKLHFGKTLWPGCLRFHRGTITAKGYPPQACLIEHPIRSWFGLSGARWFVGIICTDATRDVREVGK